MLWRSTRPDTGESNQAEKFIGAVCVARRRRLAPSAHRFRIGSRGHTLRTFECRKLSLFPLSLAPGGTRQGHIDVRTRIAMRLGDLNLRRLCGENLTATARKVCNARSWRLETLTSSESTAAAAFHRCFLERQFECALLLQSIILSPGRRV